MPLLYYNPITQSTQEHINMLGLAIKAHLPVVTATTKDVVNLPDILFEVSGKQPLHYKAGVTMLAENSLYYNVQVPESRQRLGSIYSELVKLESTLLVVNSPIKDIAYFESGEVPIPKHMMHTMLNAITGDDNLTRPLVRALGGVTLKEGAELSRLTMARDQSLTSGGIIRTRKEYFQSQTGLFLVDPAQPFYLPDDKLYQWAIQQKPFFLNSPDPRLMPRGLLFDGEPGVGKSSGAKYLAELWEVPLYRVDIGATKSKYVGQSENNLISNLNRLDMEEPCIVLFDEIEKVFAGGSYGDSGTTTTMLSQVLWWLAERTTRVLAIMTTNNVGKLPPELYRDGRIDKVMVFKGLNRSQATGFVEEIASTFKMKLTAKQLDQAVKAGFAGEGHATILASHASLTQAVYEQIKIATLSK